MHHDQTVAKTKGITHIVRDHEGGEVVCLHQSFCQLEYFFCRFGVKRCRMFIQQQKSGFDKRCHQKRQSLSLTAGEQADMGTHAIFQAQSQAFCACASV